MSLRVGVELTWRTPEWAPPRGAWAHHACQFPLRSVECSSGPAVAARACVPPAIYEKQSAPPPAPDKEYPPGHTERQGPCHPPTAEPATPELEPEPMNWRKRSTASPGPYSRGRNCVPSPGRHSPPTPEPAQRRGSGEKSAGVAGGKTSITHLRLAASIRQCVDCSILPMDCHALGAFCCPNSDAFRVATVKSSRLIHMRDPSAGKKRDCQGLPGFPTIQWMAVDSPGRHPTNNNNKLPYEKPHKTPPHGRRGRSPRQQRGICGRSNSANPPRRGSLRDGTRPTGHHCRGLCRPPRRQPSERSACGAHGRPRRIAAQCPRRDLRRLGGNEVRPFSSKSRPRVSQHSATGVSGDSFVFPGGARIYAGLVSIWPAAGQATALP